jgi:hypothetical protein
VKKSTTEKDALARAWQEVGQGTDEHLAHWHTQHPRATFAQIEAQVDRQLAALRAKLIEQMTQHAPVPSAREARCPTCGGRVMTKGRRSRKLRAAGEQAVSLERERLFCPACEVGFFPPR